MKKITQEKREKGITLIALVVTIVVLLILAGVSINLILGQNGLIARSKEAKQKTDTSKIEEELKLAITNMETEYYVAGQQGTLKDYIFSHEQDLKSALGTSEVVLDESGSIINYKGKMYELSDDGTITSADGVALSTRKITLAIDGDTMPTEKITATLVNVTGEISWNSLDTRVATVGEKGTEVTVTAVAVGTTTITATCGEYSKTCEIKVVTPNPDMDGVAASVYYGQEIDYSVDLDGNENTNDWKIFYNDGINVYIIASDYVKNTHSAMPKELGMKTYEDYSIYWNSSDLPETITGAENIFGDSATPITKYLGNKYLKTWKIAMSTTMSTYDNAKKTAALLDTNAWSGFATGVNGAYAIGSPTVEMWVASWNAKHGENSNDENKLQIYCDKAYSRGYYVGTTSKPWSWYIEDSVMVATTGYNDKLYYPHQEDVDKCHGYYLASPSPHGSEGYSMMYVRYSGAFSDNRYGTSNCLRPVVCLPSDITVKYNETDKIWNIVKK